MLKVLLIVFGVGVFGGDFAIYTENIAGKAYNRRWGYWIYIPAIISLFFSSFFYPFEFFYQIFAANNIVHSSDK